MSPVPHEALLRRAAREIRNATTVNLGIGLPTALTDYIAAGTQVCIHSENGLSGMGPVLNADRYSHDVIDAGGTPVSTLPGGAYFDSAVSFALVRGGRLDLAVLGAFEVAQNGDLANWTIPGKFSPGAGGAIDLASKARRVVVVTTHRDKLGRPKLVSRCSLPLTGRACVDRIITEMAVIDVAPSGFILREIAAGLSVDEVIAASGAPIGVPDGTLPTF